MRSQSPNYSLHEGEGSLINTIHWVRFPRNGFCPHAPVAQLKSVQKQKPPIPHPPADGSVQLNPSVLFRFLDVAPAHFQKSRTASDAVTNTLPHANLDTCNWATSPPGRLFRVKMHRPSIRIRTAQRKCSILLPTCGARALSKISKRQSEDLHPRGGGGFDTSKSCVIPAYVGAWLVGGSFPGSDVRPGFVAPPLASPAHGGRYFSRFVSGDGDHTDAFS